MNSTEFKWRYENANPGTHYFDQKTMKCFGDTMRNFGVCSEGKKTREVLTAYENPTKSKEIS